MKKIILIFITILSSFIYAQTDTIKYQWPFEPFNESRGINGTFSEFRNTGSADHFHNAVDIGEPDGNPVYPCLDGYIHSIVTNLGSNNYVSIRTKIGEKWKRITYLHISPNPTLYVGQQVTKGEDVIGYIYSGMGHVHLIERELVNDPNDYAVEINNIRNEGGLNPYVDPYPPIIHSSSIEFRLNGTEIKLPANSLADKVDIIVKIEEQNGPATINKNNGTYIIGYRVWSEDTSVVVYEPDDNGMKYKFFRKPYDNDVHNVFLKGVATLSNPVYIITNGRGASYINNNRSVNDNYFDTGLLEEGNYQLEIFSEDTRGNFVNKFFPITITNRDVFPPSSPELLAIENYDNRKSVRVIYSQNSEPDIAGYRLYYTENTLLQNWKLAADENILTQNITSYEFSSPLEFIEPFDGDVYFFYLTAVDSSGNESNPSDIYSRSSFVNGINYTKVLVVDGFDRYGGSGSWQKPTHSFNTKYFIALTILDSFVVSSCSNEAVLNDYVNLNNYDLVIWFCGDESTVDNTLTIGEQSRLANFLEEGGNLFITGSEIGWDLDRLHSNSEASDTLFYRHYLKSKFVYNGNTTMTRVNGVTGTPFEGLSLSFGETYPEDYPDDIDPLYGGEVLFNYNQMRDGITTPRNAAVGYKGTFGNSSIPGAMIYVTYSVESMGSISQIVELLSSSVAYFDLSTDIKEYVAKPNDFILYNNFPNPFNPSTNIKFYLPSAMKLTITVYDLLGREIDRVLNKYLSAGFHTVTWDASNYASGIYYARVKGENISQIIKMTLIK